MIDGTLLLAKKPTKYADPSWIWLSERVPQNDGLENNNGKQGTKN